MFDIIHDVFHSEHLPELITKAKEYYIPYIDLTETEQRIYITRDSLLWKKDSFFELLYRVNVLHQQVVPKVIRYLLEEDRLSLPRLGLSDRMCRMIENEYDRYARMGLLPTATYYGRYDALIDSTGEIKIVELNAETPAGLPEASLASIYESLRTGKGRVNVNEEMDYKLYQSFRPLLERIKQSRSTKNRLLVVFANDNDENEYNGEDYINTLHVTEFFKRQLDEHGITVWMGNIDDVEVKAGGVYYDGHKQDYIRSFYPLEWLFVDNGSAELWDSRAKGEWEILNGLLSLVPQSKAFWAYAAENIDHLGINTEEKHIFMSLVPRYSFEKPIDKETVSKPLFYREGVGIGDENYIGLKVYQEKVQQKQFCVHTFEGEKKGYFTLGFYFGSQGFIGTYHRFCENPITDRTAYYIPSFLPQTTS